MKENKTAIFVFRGDPVCFVHALLNAIDRFEKGGTVKMIMEGEATRLIRELRKPEHSLHGLYEKAKKSGLIDAVCRACAIKTGVPAAAAGEGFRLADDISGHASMAPFIEQGYEIITL
jgi:hypothetical protein